MQSDRRSLRLRLLRRQELLGPADAAAIKSALPGTMLMRSVPVYGKAGIEIARSYERIADYLLLDSHRPSDRQTRESAGVSSNW